MKNTDYWDGTESWVIDEFNKIMLEQAQITPLRLGIPPKEDVVHHPSHYTSHPSGIECIEISKHMNFPLGSAMKYIWRAGLKDDALLDLRKAKEYIDIEIGRIEGLDRKRNK